MQRFVKYFREEKTLFQRLWELCNCSSRCVASHYRMFNCKCETEHWNVHLSLLSAHSCPSTAHHSKIINLSGCAGTVQFTHSSRRGKLQTTTRSGRLKQSSRNLGRLFNWVDWIYAHHSFCLVSEDELNLLLWCRNTQKWIALTLSPHLWAFQSGFILWLNSAELREWKRKKQECFLFFVSFLCEPYVLPWETINIMTG